MDNRNKYESKETNKKQGQGEHVDSRKFTGSAKVRNTVRVKKGLIGLPIDIPNKNQSLYTKSCF
jgi:hypothetical protein